MRLLLTVRLIALALFTTPVFAERIYFNGEDWRGGFYDVPDDLAKDEKVWVVVDVHGANLLKGNKSTAELVKLLEPAKVIIYIPSFKNGYQSGSGKYAEKFIAEFGKIKEVYNVHDKMFIHGFSGGAQFVHRFAFNHPDYVIGVSAHSGGSWSTGSPWGEINTKAKDIPFAISCGKKDLKITHSQKGWTRLDWYKEFDKQMKQQEFVLGSTAWNNFPHRPLLRRYGPLVRECFFLATEGEIPESDYWTGDVEKVAKKAKNRAEK